MDFFVPYGWILLGNLLFECMTHSPGTSACCRKHARYRAGCVRKHLGQQWSTKPVFPYEDMGIKTMKLEDSLLNLNFADVWGLEFLSTS